MAKIMLVEDDNNLREIYGARLLAEGHEIVTAKDGEEALAIAVKEKPELIISDVMMPKISGFDMLDILRNAPETKFTKVIMMTALSQTEDKARADSLGADRYLVKSQVTLEDVARVVRDVLDGKTETDSAVPADPAAQVEPQQATETEVASKAEDTSSPVTELPATQPEQPQVATNSDSIPQEPVDVETVTNTTAVEPASEPQVQTPAELSAPETPPAPAVDSVESIIDSPQPIIVEDTSPTASPTTETAPELISNAEPTASATPVQVNVSSDPPATTPDPVVAQQVDDQISSAIADIASSVTQTDNAVTSDPTASIQAPTATDESVASQEPATQIKVELPATDTPTTPTVENSAPVEPQLETTKEAEPVSVEIGPNLAEALQQETGDESTAQTQPETEPENTTPTIVNGAENPVVAPTTTTPETESAQPASEGNESVEPTPTESPLNESTKKKGVIQPINDITSGPNLDALLEAEEKKAAVQNPPANSVVTPTTNEQKPATPSQPTPTTEHDIISL